MLLQIVEAFKLGLERNIARQENKFAKEDYETAREAQEAAQEKVRRLKEEVTSTLKVTTREQEALDSHVSERPHILGFSSRDLNALH